ncbi:FAD-dependent oxidoreductase [Microbispora hainanensis]|uniref:FAD-dependent oxidoreductase n=1 Tax=Microbispora hainanensis TaxID=568844 RepID=UPI0033E73D90
MANNKVVVIGGGYAGALAANRLQSRADVDITLVNPRPEFVERVRLHQFVAGTGQATVDYAALLGEGVRPAVDSATVIDTAARTVLLASGRTLDYDYLIYAVGSTASIPPSVPDAAEFAYGIAEFEAAQRLRTRLEELPLDAPITVVGGGSTGIETAAELAERGRAVTLVCGRSLAPSFGPSGRRAARGAGRRHRAEPHRRVRSRGDRPGLLGRVCQPRPARRRTADRPQGRRRDERLCGRPHRCGDQGAHLQVRGDEDPARGQEAGFGQVAQGRPAPRTAGARGARNLTLGPACSWRLCADPADSPRAGRLSAATRGDLRSWSRPSAGNPPIGGS